MSGINTRKIIELGHDSSLSATEVLIAVLEYLGENPKHLRIAVLAVEEEGENGNECYLRFTNARSLAEEVGIITIVGKDARRLELADENAT